MKKTVCIPAFNESDIIGKIIRECKKYSDLVIVCDDGSSDNTYFEAESAGAIVVKHNQNLGKGAALRTLFKTAIEHDSDVVVTIDGDGQFLPEEIPNVMSPVIQKKSDIVIGYRFETSDEMPSYRKVGNKFLDKITNMASELPFRDTQSGFRSYSKKALEMIKFSTNGFGADSEILIDASKKGLKISEQKITVLYNTGSKTSTKNPMSHTVGVITSLLELIALKRPLSYVGIPGLLLAIVGIVFSVNVVTIFNETRYFSVPTTLIAVGSLVTGLMLFMMSIVLFSISRTQSRS